jgi:hypothetical protein
VTGRADPQLVDEQVPVGVELTVADARGQHHQFARVVEHTAPSSPSQSRIPTCRRGCQRDRQIHETIRKLYVQF